MLSRVNSAAWIGRVVDQDSAGLSVDPTLQVLQVHLVAAGGVQAVETHLHPQRGAYGAVESESGTGRQQVLSRR